MSTRSIGFAVLALGLIGGGLFVGMKAYRASAPIIDPAGAAVDRAPTRISALGRIEPQSELIHVSAGLSDRLDSLSVKRGDLVKKDQIVGYLQSYPEQVAQRDQIAAQIGETKTRLATQIDLDQARIQSAEIKLRQVGDISPLRLSAQRATIDSIQAGLHNDLSLLEADRQLLSRSASSKQEFDRRETLVAQDKANLVGAQARLTELNQQFELDRLDGDVQVSLAKASLARAKADLSLDSLVKQLDYAEARVRRAEIRVPIDGRILNITAHPGEQVGATPVLTMGNTEKMRVVAEVYETDSAAIRIGQRATITSRVFAEPLTGTVVEIGQMIFKNDVLNVDPASKADARVIEARIELDDAHIAERFTNLTVDVLIDVAPQQQAKPEIARR